MFTGLNVLGGIAAMLHGVGRAAAPDTRFTATMSTVRKALAPDITVIQESVKMMAPLPDNERSGLRDTLSVAAREITGVDLGALKHQLNGPDEGTEPLVIEEPRPLPQGPTVASQAQPRPGRRFRRVAERQFKKPELDELPDEEDLRVGGLGTSPHVQEPSTEPNLHQQGRTDLGGLDL
ncbi:hypothetical protein ACIRF8_35695 [Streptomyces sp. NPDC102406]|uniref:hypothetical protein n=1 Tax=Streptomyces sp. NPDC102406 TaxID=3366171 RepID=UPI00382FF0B5